MLTRRLFGAGFDDVVARLQGGEVSWYGTDRQGSVRTIFDNSGGVVASSDFDAWGNVTAGALTDRYGFTGLDWDGFTRLWMPANGRPYDSGSGRWLAGDEKGFDAGDVNLSRYVGNGPTNGVDPSGYEDAAGGLRLPPALDKFGALGGVAGITGRLMNGPIYADKSAKELDIERRIQEGLATVPPDQRRLVEELARKSLARSMGRAPEQTLEEFQQQVREWRETSARRKLAWESNIRREQAAQIERDKDEMRRISRHQRDVELNRQALLKAGPPLTGSFSEGAGYVWSEWVGYFTRPLPKSPTSTGTQLTPGVGPAIEAGAALDEGMYSRALVYGGIAVFDVSGLPSLGRALGRGAVWSWSKAFGRSAAKQGADDVAKIAVKEAPAKVRGFSHAEGGKWEIVDQAASDAALKKLRSQPGYYPGVPVELESSAFSEVELLLMSEGRSAEHAATIGPNGTTFIVSGSYYGVSPSAVPSGSRWIHAHPGRNNVAPSASDILLATSDDFVKMEMTILARRADGGVARLTFKADEVARLKGMIKEGKGLDRYTKEYAEYMYNRYKAEGLAIDGTDLEKVMSHVGVPK